MSARQLGSHFEMWSWTLPLFLEMKASEQATETAVNQFGAECKAARAQARTPHTIIYMRNLFSQQIEISPGVNALLIPKHP